MNDSAKVWWIFFILGMGTLLPWNFFITPNSYWIDKLKMEPNTATERRSIENGTANGTLEVDEGPNMYQNFWNSTMALATMGTNFIMCFLTSFMMNIVSRHKRFYIPIAGIGVCFAIVAAMTQIESSTWVPTFFGLTMINVCVITAFCAIFQASLFGHSGEIGGVMSAVMGGQGAGGVFACLVDILAKLFIDDLANAACMYFVIAVIFMVISAFFYYYLQQIDSYQEQLIQTENGNEDEKIELKDELKVQNTHEQETAFGAIKRVVWPYHLTLILTFAVTLSLFPGVVVRIQPANYDKTNSTGTLTETQQAYYDRFFHTIWVFLGFNLFDFIGRMASGPFTQKDSPFNIIKKDQPIRLILCAVLRFIFVLLFMKCNVAKNEDAPDIWFQSDIIFICIMALFSFTNGLFSSIAMCYGPQVAPEHLREQIGGYLGTTLVAGLFLGACLSFLFVPLSAAL